VGVVNLVALVNAVARAWHSRWLSVLFLVPFVALAARGLFTGIRELNDVDAQVRVEMHYVHTLARDVSLTGRATFASLRTDRMGAILIGPFTIAVDCRDVAEVVLHLDVVWENSRLGDSWRVEDEATGKVHLIDNLVAYRTVIRLPLPQPHTALRFVPSNPTQGLRIFGLKLLSHVEMTPLVVRQNWRTVHDDGVTSAAIGAGFWPFTQSGTRLQTKRCAYMNLKTSKPGPHLMRWSFRRPDPDAMMPIVALKGRRIWCPPAGETVWGRMVTEQGLTTIELKLDLAAGDNWICIECPGVFRSPWERGLNADKSRYAYDIDLASCAIVPDKP
jgi:hypothetical protein